MAAGFNPDPRYNGTITDPGHLEFRAQMLFALRFRSLLNPDDAQAVNYFAGCSWRQLTQGAS